jgi:hypothetical protein
MSHITTPASQGTRDRTEATSTGLSDKDKRDMMKGKSHSRRDDPIRKLYHMKAKDGDDIIAHLLEIKNLWEHIKMICYKPKLDTLMNDEQFKFHVATTLPPSWDTFSCSLIDNQSINILNIHNYINEYIREYEKHAAYSRNDIA